ncbi:proline-rich receptor-like protein kinase PERK7 [Mercurialis annua]|uniref:proline-rich receptor-like protein kinase PERK7 n=1 Tax=Mercurialis annua TaxID=3986 RepID=UPI00215DED0F|nr:proline-rich receptor-like protein kinase PERK7 [Mercurialis annua]
MATAPVKPQQLHNFPLSLKWGQTTTLATASTNNHRNSQCLTPPPPPPPTTTSTLAPDSETESDPEPSQSDIRYQRQQHPPPPPRVGSRSARVQRFSFSPCATLLPNQVKNSPTASPQKSEGGNATVLDEGNNNKKKEVVEEEEEGENSRPWKLRPRKGILSGFKETTTFQVNDHQQQKENSTHFQPPKSARLRGLVESSSTASGVLGVGLGLGSGGVTVEKKEKLKFWISLSREEIEEDIFIMTGSRPSRRPKKRPKNVQKALDNTFPGMWLVGTTADSYRLIDPPVKR